MPCSSSSPNVITQRVDSHEQPAEQPFDQATHSTGRDLAAEDEEARNGASELNKPEPRQYENSLNGYVMLCAVPRPTFSFGLAFSILFTNSSVR